MAPESADPQIVRPEKDNDTTSSLALRFIDKICKRFGYSVPPEPANQDHSSTLYPALSLLTKGRRISR